MKAGRQTSRRPGRAFFVACSGKPFQTVGSRPACHRGHGSPLTSDPQTALVPLHSDFDRLVVLSEDVKALKQNRILPPDCRKQPVKTSVQRY